MILRQRATVKRSFTISELHAGPARIGTHRPPSTKAGLAGWQEARSQNSGISPDPEAPDRTRIRILSLDSHPLFREGIAGIISEEPDLVLVSQASTVQEAIQQTSIVPGVTTGTPFFAGGRRTGKTAYTLA
jgi:hypothetical protein